MTNDFSSKSKNTNSELEQWCVEQLTQSRLSAMTAFTPLSGDASFRKYYRITCEQTTYIGVFAPPEHEKNPEFIAMTAKLHEAGITAPDILAYDEAHGFLLQTDLGDTLLFDVLNTGSVDHWYSQAMATLSQLQTIKPGILNPAYNSTRIIEDLQRFPQWYVQGLLQYEMLSSEEQLFADFCGQLSEQMLEQTQVLTHYDYQSRNLMITPEQSLAVIDYQDALQAPITYDLASLLRDCYIRWPAQQVRSWVTQYAALARKQGLLANSVNDEQFQNWFDASSLQRHIRVLGTFARLHLRDKKSNYLNDIPLVALYVNEVCAQHPSYQRFSTWFSSSLQPLAEQQSWYTPPQSTQAK